MTIQPFPESVDLMPRENSALPPYGYRRLIAFALSICDVKWAGHILSETSIPVNQVLDALDKGGWKIVPKERSDFERGGKAT